MSDESLSAINEPAPNRDQENWWESFRAYLRLLVETQIDPRLRSKTDLSGIVQQTLWEAHQSGELRQSSTSERLKWLRRVLANNLADEVRKFRSDKRNVDREVGLQISADHSLDRLADLIADNSTPSAPIRREELALRLAVALDRLPSAQREALLLQHWHGWKLAEIASQMDKTRLAVAGLLKRGLQQLRVELVDWE